MHLYEDEADLAADVHVKLQEMSLNCNTWDDLVMKASIYDDKISLNKIALIILITLSSDYELAFTGICNCFLRIS